MSTLQTTILKHPDSTTNNIRVDSSGRVGFGGADTPVGVVTIYDSTNAYLYFQNSASGTSGGDGFSVLHHSSLDTFIANRDNGDIAIEAGNSEALRIKSDRRVALGTTAPPATADLTVRAPNPELSLYASANFSSYLMMGDTDDYDNGYIEYDNHDPNKFMKFAVNGGEHARLTKDGYFKASYDGNYTSTSGKSHELHGTQPNYYTLHVKCDGADPLSHYITEFKFNSSSPNNSNARFLQCRDNAGVRADILSNGGIANFQSNDSNLCDEREKKNIVSLDAKWDKVKSWELKKFHYNEDADTDDLRYGVIAQQVEVVCPEVLTDWVMQKAQDAVLDEDGNVVEPAQEEILRKGVKEQQMVWMAIKALQEAMAKIETLEAKVAALEAG